MPFEILSPLSTSDGPNSEAEYVGVSRSVTVELQPNVDAAGGALSVLSTTDATETEPATATVQYSAADGTMTQATFDLPEGYILTSDTGVVFGEGLDSFLITGYRVGLTDDGEPGQSITLLEVGLDDTDTPQSLGFSNALRPDLFEDSRVVVEFLSIYPTGDGRVGYSTSATRDDWGTTHGIIEDTADGIDATRLGSGLFTDARVIALDDGGYLYVEQFAGDSGPTIAQYDADGVEVGSQVIVPETLNTDTVTFDTLDLTLVVNDAGELDVFVAQGDTFLRVEYDLLPASDLPVVQPPLVVPTEGDDVFSLSDEDDVLDALGGNDTIKGLGGKDWIIGGDGDDSIDGGRGDDALIAGTPVEPVDGEEAGDAAPSQGGLYGGEGADSINGRMGSDWIDGGAGDDDLRGGLGSERSYTTEDGELREAGLFGGEGDDFMRGNRGIDDMEGGAGNDDMNGGFGDDNLFGGSGDDKLSGFDGNDLLWAGSGDDTLHGGRGADDLAGDDGNDVLRGAQGDDFLEGGNGDDLLIGGQGSDTFFYYLSEANGTDTIKDFTIGQDTFEILSDDELTFDDLFLSQEDSVAVIQANDTTIRLNGVDVDDLSEDDVVFI